MEQEISALKQKADRKKKLDTELPEREKKKEAMDDPVAEAARSGHVCQGDSRNCMESCQTRGSFFPGPGRLPRAGKPPRAGKLPRAGKVPSGSRESSPGEENSLWTRSGMSPSRTTVRDKVLREKTGIKKEQADCLARISSLEKQDRRKEQLKKDNEEIDKSIRLLSEEVNSLQVSIGALKQKQISLQSNIKGSTGKTFNYPGRKEAEEAIRPFTQQSRKILRISKMPGKPAIPCRRPSRK